MNNINHIVLVDDNKIDCFINQKIIGLSFKKTITKTFNNSVYALDYFRNALKKTKVLPPIKTDLILLDINMPIMNGFEFLNELSKIKGFIEQPIDVYFLSSSQNERDISNAFASMFCSGYIIKPLTKNKLKKAVESKFIRKNPIRSKH